METTIEVKLNIPGEAQYRKFTIKLPSYWRNESADEYYYLYSRGGGDGIGCDILHIYPGGEIQYIPDTNHPAWSDMVATDEGSYSDLRHALISELQRQESESQKEIPAGFPEIHGEEKHSRDNIDETGELIKERAA